MTTFDRFEREIPDLMAELAPTRVPDYVDDMLRQTAGIRQRPAWSALERWLPMGVIARTQTFPRVPWRYVALAAAVLLIAAAGLVYVGSRRQALPPPFGLARNGEIVFATANGDIAALDPATGASRTIISGAAVEEFPGFSLDGTRLIFARATSDTSIEQDYLADADGSNVRDFITGSAIKWYDESGSGDRAIVSRTVGSGVVQSMVDIKTGHETPLPVDPALGITLGWFRPGRDQVIYEHVPPDGATGTTIYLADGDGGGTLRPLPISPDAVNEAWPSPDGSRLVYTSWGTGSDEQGRIHVVDIDSGVDTPLMFDGSAGTTELAPQWSPDSRQLAFLRYGDAGFRVTLVSADGTGRVSQVGPTEPVNSGGAEILWSPDGAQLLVAYQPDDSVWLLPANGGDGHQLTDMAWDRGITWQRLAP